VRKRKSLTSMVESLVRIPLQDIKDLDGIKEEEMQELS
jgi:hypothetical protein